jgi:hypothetical protein
VAGRPDQGGILEAHGEAAQGILRHIQGVGEVGGGAAGRLAAAIQRREYAKTQAAPVAGRGVGTAMKPLIVRKVLCTW